MYKLLNLRTKKNVRDDTNIDWGRHENRRMGSQEHWIVYCKSVNKGNPKYHALIMPLSCGYVRGI